MNAIEVTPSKESNEHMAGCLKGLQIRENCIFTVVCPD